MKKAIICLVIGMMLLSAIVSGCTGRLASDDFNSTGSVYNSANSSGEKVTINYIADATWPEKMQKINEESFYKDHPNIQVNIEGYPFNQIFEVIQVKLSAGDDHFDIISVDVPMVAGYGYKNFLMPLNQYFSNEEMDKIVPSAIEAGTFNGQFLSPPMMNSSQLFYNKDLLQKAGLELPSEDPQKRLTWEQITESSKIVMSKINPSVDNGIWALSFDQIDRPYQMLALPNSLGVKGVGADGLTVDGVLNSVQWLKAMQWYGDIHNSLKIAPKALKPGETVELFKSGKLAYFVGGPWCLTNFDGVENLNWGFAPHPYFEGSNAATPTGSWHFGINKASKHAKEAVEWVKFMSIGEGNAKWFEALGNIPATRDILGDIIDDKDGKYKNFPNRVYKLCAFEIMNTAFPRPVTPGFGEWDTTVTAMLSDIRNGADPKVSLDDAVAKLNITLAKYK